MITIHSVSHDDSRLSAVVSGIDEHPDFNLWFSAPTTTQPDLIGDPFLAALLPVAMKLGHDIEIWATVSVALLQQIKQIQAIWSQWHGWRPVDVIAPATTERQYNAGSTGCFFSGGVDSFYTALKLLEGERKPSHLIFAHGFDIPLSSTDRYARVQSRIEKIAQEMNVETVFPSSNIRELTNDFCDWGLVQHGAALAGLALSMQHEFRTMVVPATHTYSDSFPWGSHPLVDPLWSTESLRIVHDGCEATRVQKVIRLAKSSVALSHVRVCWKTHEEYNCGRCEKCVRTMVNLAVAGCLDRCATFHGTLSKETVLATLANADTNTIAFAKENLEGLKMQKIRRDLQGALHSVVNRKSPGAAIKRRIKMIDDAIFGGAVRRTMRAAR